MRSIAQLTAGARRAAPDAEGAPRRPPPGGSGRPPPAAVGDAPASREALLRLVEGVAPRLGLTDRALRALRAVVTACRWADFTGERPNPVCFRQQQRLAQDIGVTPGHFRKLETQLERAGLLTRATCENGHRGRLAPGPGAPVAGLSLVPLLQAVPRLAALAEAMAAERQALAEGRSLIRIERRGARHAVEGLSEAHPARAAYAALRGTRFRSAALYETPAAIAAHLAELRAVIEAAPAPEDDAVEAAIEAVREALSEGLDHAIRSGAPLAQERHHTKVQTDPQTGSWSAGASDEEPRDDRAAAQGAAGELRREEGRAAAAARNRVPGCERPEEAEEAREERPGPGRTHDHEADEDAAGVPPSRLAPALLRRLTPRALRSLASDEMRLYVDRLDPRGQGPTLRGLERAALLRRRELAITPEAWEEAEAALGWLDALVALVVIDRNRDHPTAPVRNPGGLLRDLARRRRAGTLDLGASVIGIWRREEAGASVAAACSPEAP